MSFQIGGDVDKRNLIKPFTLLNYSQFFWGAIMIPESRKKNDREDKDGLFPKPPSVRIVKGRPALAKARICNTHIVLPAYNEEESLPPLLKRLASINNHSGEIFVWVVDDGSVDNTAAIVLDGAPGL
ncbi:MAG: hypothetical protein AMJ53_15315, partial [Gammaproteobacteria bacterium SG8_11]